MMKGLLLSAFCLVFLFLSLSINEALASIIKTIIAWGCFVFFIFNRLGDLEIKIRGR